MRTVATVSMLASRVTCPLNLSLLQSLTPIPYNLLPQLCQDLLPMLRERNVGPSSLWEQKQKGGQRR